MVDPAARIAPARGRMGFQMAESNKHAFLQAHSFRKAWNVVYSVSIRVEGKHIAVQFRGKNKGKAPEVIAMLAPYISAKNPIRMTWRDAKTGRLKPSREFSVLRQDTEYAHLVWGRMMQPRNLPAPASE